MSWIAFDAAKRCTGWAFRDRSGAWITGVVEPANTGALRLVFVRAIEHGVTHAVIENCFMGRNVHTLKTLQEAQTRITLMCEWYGLPVTLVYPATWQAAFGIGGDSADRKAGALRVANWLGCETKSPDIADAVCLCDYQTKHGQQMELELRGPRGGKMWGRR